MAVKRRSRAAVPDNISEEYYQISQEILGSFSKFRPPVDLFQFRDDIKRLYPFSRKGQRLSAEQIEEVQALCDAQSLFVSRTDHPIYSEHIVKQVDLILLDANLKEKEIADILIRALHLRLSHFIDQPVLPVFEILYRDLMVFTEYLSLDKYRIKLFMRRLFVEHTLVNHSLNTLVVGLWLFIYSFASADFKRRHLDRCALGLMLHDFGMSKLPGFILGKTSPLKQEEKDKILLHPLAGMKSLQKLNLGFDELMQAIMEHHERLDGSGYPQKTKEISRFGALVAVADSFSAMITQRPYAGPKGQQDAAQELANDKRYEPRLTTALLNAFLTSAFDVTSKQEEEHAQSENACALFPDEDDEEKDEEKDTLL